MKAIFKILISVMSVSSCFAEASYEWMIDMHMSPYAGGEDLLTLHKSLEKKEDQFFSYKEAPSQTFTSSLGRFAELSLFWWPLSLVTVTTQHEVFGHGYRARSLNNAKVTGYKIDLPYPYGSSGGATMLAFSQGISLGELQAITVAGLEAENILATQVLKKWIAGKKIDGRASALYSSAKLGTLNYVFATELEKKLREKENAFYEQKQISEDPLDGNDIIAYVNTMNLIYPEYNMTTTSLCSPMVLNCLDPALINSIVSFWYYVITGKAMNQWMIPLTSNLSYLPSISVQIAPYGVEYYLDNYFAYQDRPIYAYYKMGKYAGMTYGGAGIEFDEIYKGSVLSFGCRAHTWVQPKFVTSYTYYDYLNETPINAKSKVDLETNQAGFAFSLITKYIINNTYTNLYAEIGGKTKGYLPGYSLNGSPVARIGISGEF